MDQYTTTLIQIKDLNHVTHNSSSSFSYRFKDLIKFGRLFLINYLFLTVFTSYKVASSSSIHSISIELLKRLVLGLRFSFNTQTHIMNNKGKRKMINKQSSAFPIPLSESSSTLSVVSLVELDVASGIVELLGEGSVLLNVSPPCEMGEENVVSPCVKGEGVVEVTDVFRSGESFLCVVCFCVDASGEQSVFRTSVEMVTDVKSDVKRLCLFSVEKRSNEVEESVEAQSGVMSEQNDDVSVIVVFCGMLTSADIKIVQLIIILKKNINGVNNSDLQTFLC